MTNLGKDYCRKTGSRGGERLCRVDPSHLYLNCCLSIAIEILEFTQTKIFSIKLNYIRIFEVIFCSLKNFASFLFSGRCFVAFKGRSVNRNVDRFHQFFFVLLL